MEADSHPVVSNLMHNLTCVCTDTQTHIYKRHTQTYIKENVQQWKKLKQNNQHIQSKFSFQSIHVSSVGIYLFTY